MIIATLVILVILALLGGLYAYRIAFYMPRQTKEKGPPKLEGTPYEAYREEIVRLYRQIRDRECEFVTIQSRDGLTLSGRYYHVRDGAPVDIGFHGYRSSAFVDFAGGSELSFQMGHNLLLVDQRAHGKSDGHTITFGILEREDVLCWVEYALKRFGSHTKLLLYGVSMGAATVLMASELPLPDNVKGIVADCPFSSPLDIILHVGRTNPLPQWLIRPFVILGAAIYGGFDLLRTDGQRAAAQARVPILILHGEADNFVPCAMSQAPALANPGLVQRFTFPGAGHALSYLSDPARYRQIVEAFVDKVLED